MPALRRDRHGKIHNPSERCRLRFQGPRRAVPVKEDFLCLPQCVRKAYSSSPQRKNPNCNKIMSVATQALKKLSSFRVVSVLNSAWYRFTSSLSICICVSADSRKEFTPGRFPLPRLRRDLGKGNRPAWILNWEASRPRRTHPRSGHKPAPRRR